MLLLDEIARQVMQIDFSRNTEHRIDFVKACEQLPQANLSVKQAQRHWDQFRRRLREYNKRESEFVSLARLEVNKEASFGNTCEKRVNFLKRMKLYDQRLQQTVQKPHSMFQSDFQSAKPTKILKKIEKRDSKLALATQHYSRFILGPEPNPQQAKFFDRIHMSELKESVAMVRFAS